MSQILPQMVSTDISSTYANDALVVTKVTRASASIILTLQNV